MDPQSQKRQWDRGVSCAQDWVVCHVTTAESLKGHTKDPSWALQHAELTKVRNEAGACENGDSSSFSATDTFGGFSEKAQAAIARVANEGRVFRNEDEAPSAKRIAQKLRLVALRDVGYQIVRRQLGEGMPDEDISKLSKLNWRPT